MSQSNHKEKGLLIRIVKSLVRILFVATVTIAANSIASYATIPETPNDSLFKGDEYWENSAQMNEETPRPEPVPPQTLSSKAGELEEFIGVDLEAMQLYLYKDGEVDEAYEIISKGEPGSHFETPSGEYKINERKEEGLSPTGDVYLPYNQQFYGNFSIHGWPYQSGGERVSEEYSGGSIQLSTEDAATLFSQTEAGLPIVIVGGADNSAEVSAPNLPAPTVEAKAYIVADIETGQVFAEKQAEKAFPIASISKLMTAVVANETIAYNDSITISDTAISTYGAAGGLAAGEQLPLRTLYRPLLLESSNDAATAIAEHKGFHSFMSLMNRKASALDMDTAHFADPSGLSAENIASARDLFRLTRYINGKKKFIWDITTLTQETLPDEASNVLRNFINNNPMVGRADFVGGKNGYTDEARHTLLSVFRTPVNEVQRNVAVIVLGSETHAADTQQLLSWLRQGD